jgi:hemolysin III
MERDERGVGGRVGDRVSSQVNQVGESVQSAIHDIKQEIKPRLRGWLHAVTSPLTVAAGIVLVVLSPTAMTRIGSAVFMLSAALLFTVSAVYHRGNWSPRTWRVLQRLDHANIFLLIAGSYTPFTLLMLEGTDRVVLLSVVWGGAAAGVLARVLWAGAPRWVFVPIYIALGWAAIFYAGDFVAAGDVPVFTLIAVGGLLYTVGGVVYALQRPDPWPTWFGFHEVFHTFTILAFVTHYVGISLATYSLR